MTPIAEIGRSGQRQLFQRIKQLRRVRQVDMVATGDQPETFPVGRAVRHTGIGQTSGQLLLRRVGEAVVLPAATVTEPGIVSRVLLSEI